MMNIIYIAVAIPYNVAFVDKTSIDLFVGFEGISIFIQSMVILSNFRTPVVIAGGYSLEFMPVLKNYARNGLLIDLVGAVPFNMVLGIVKLENKSLYITALLRLTRIIGFL